MSEQEPRIPAFFINTIKAYIRHSTVITATGMLVASSAMAAPAKGIIYAMVTIVAIFVRIGILMLTSYSGPENTSLECEGDLPDQLKFYDGGRNNIFMLSMSLFYIGLPMLLAKDAKWHLLFMLVVQLALSCFVLFGNRCIVKPASYLLEIAGGAIYGCAVSVIMYYSGLRSWLMISGIPTENGGVKPIQNLKCVLKKMV